MESQLQNYILSYTVLITGYHYHEYWISVSKCHRLLQWARNSVLEAFVALFVSRNDYTHLLPSVLRVPLEVHFAIDHGVKPCWHPHSALVGHLPSAVVTQSSNHKLHHHQCPIFEGSLQTYTPFHQIGEETTEICIIWSIGEL